MSQRQPDSSSTSRAAHCSNDSPCSSLPFGKVQSSYLGRWTSMTPPLRRTTPPAARTSGCCEGCNLALHFPGGDDVLVHAELLRLQAERQPDDLREVQHRDVE